MSTAPPLFAGWTTWAWRGLLLAATAPDGRTFTVGEIDRETREWLLWSPDREQSEPLASGRYGLGAEAAARRALEEAAGLHGADIEASIPVWVRRTRDLLGLNQSAFAKSCGLDMSTINGGERGKVSLGGFALSRIAAVSPLPAPGAAARLPLPAPAGSGGSPAPSSSGPPAPAVVASSVPDPSPIPGGHRQVVEDNNAGLWLDRILTAARAPADLPLPARAGWVLRCLEAR